MAQKRRGGGFRPPELRGTLGTLLRTTLQQAGVVRDAIERGARSGRSRLETFRSDRQRHEALAELGELVLDLVRRGEIDVGELPEAKDLIRHLDELDANEEVVDHEVATPLHRRRFDERGAPPRRTPGDTDDGTVAASGRWVPPTKVPPVQRVWRPVTETPSEPIAEPVRRSGGAAIPHPHGKGGISFEDDDLAEYMHPDDVPSKDRPDGDS